MIKFELNYYTLKKHSIAFSARFLDDRSYEFSGGKSV